MSDLMELLNFGMGLAQNSGPGFWPGGPSNWLGNSPNYQNLFGLAAGSPGMGAMNFGNQMSGAMGQIGQINSANRQAMQANRDRMLQALQQGNQYQLGRYALDIQRQLGMANVNSKNRLFEVLKGLMPGSGGAGAGSIPGFNIGIPVESGVKPTPDAAWNPTLGNAASNSLAGAALNTPAGMPAGPAAQQFNDLTMGAGARNFNLLDRAGTEARAKYGLAGGTARANAQNTLKGLAARRYSNQRGIAGNDLAALLQQFA